MLEIPVNWLKRSKYAAQMKYIKSIPLLKIINIKIYFVFEENNVPYSNVVAQCTHNKTY